MIALTNKAIVEIGRFGHSSHDNFTIFGQCSVKFVFLSSYLQLAWWAGKMKKNALIDNKVCLSTLQIDKE